MPWPSKYAPVRTYMIKYFLVAVSLCFCSGLRAAAPELSAEQPLVYDAQTGSLVARGNALFTHDEFTVEADEIRYDKAAKAVQASGNVRVTRAQFRLVTQTLSYNVDTKSFSCGAFRAGYPPVFLEGKSASGSMDRMELMDVVSYMGEPGTATPSLAAESMVLLPGQRVLAVGARPGVGGVRIFRLPELSGSLEEAPNVSIEGEVGFEGNLGAYVRSQVLLPVNSSLSAGVNLDLYTSRGVLIGPAVEYDYDSGDNEMKGSFGGAWISDQGDRGYDYFGRAVPQNRWYFSASHQQVISDKVYVNSFINLLSDPDMYRDFRSDVFEQNQFPDSFVEVSVPMGEDFVVSALTRFSGFGNDYAQTRRLPELRVDMLTNPLPFGGLYQTGFASFAQTDVSVMDMHFYNERVKAYYGLLRPVSLSNWLVLTPKAGAFMAHYDRSVDAETLSTDDIESATHYVGELGLDLAASFHAQWDYKNEKLGIDGLRHIVRPVVYWRKYGSSGDDDRVAYPVDLELPNLQMPIIDLRDIQSDDYAMMNDPHFVRVGVENVLQTRSEKGGSRALATLNLYQDHYIRDSSGDLSYVQLSLTPASYLNMSYETGFDTDQLHLKWQRVRLAIKSADQWSLNLYADYFDGNYEDYLSSLYYRLSRKWGCSTTVGFDAQKSEFDRASFTLLQQLGSFWQVRYRVNYHKDDLRQDDLGVSIAVAAVTF